ncbi:MAG: exonuclease SbcCD subunit D [Synechococcus sp.]
MSAPRPPLRFLHTADWQLGKPYARVADPDKRARLRQERLAAIGRLGAVAQQQGAAFIAVAGDLFDSPQPTRADVSAACSAIGALALPVLVIPGNHDHGDAGSLWQESYFLEERAQLAPNLTVLLERQPFPLAPLGLPGVVLPCPLLRRAEPLDPTAWLRSLDFSPWAAEPRLVLAHGSIQGFGGDDSGDTDDENPRWPPTASISMPCRPRRSTTWPWATGTASRRWGRGPGTPAATRWTASPATPTTAPARCCW